MMRQRLGKLFVTAILIFGMLGFNPTEVQAAYKSGINAFTYKGYSIPAYDGDPYEKVNGNDPKFTAAEKVKKAVEKYSALDELGRCGAAYANVCPELMPTAERGSIGSVKPTGWHTVKYDIVSGKYLYNRCHLIGYQLTAENANQKNLITGTRSLNVEGMLPFENMVADYVQETGNHVLYRATPVFQGDNLLASGVLLEAESVEDNEIEFCVFCYNVQDGISIDYATGESRLTNQKSIGGADVTLPYTSYVYNGAARKPAVTVKMNGKTLVKGTDYKVSYANNIKVGTAKITVTGLGNYTGTTTKTFKITARNITAATFSTVGNRAYTGSQIKPVVTVTYNGKTLVKGTDYTVAYGTNQKVGNGTITVKGKGNFKGSKQITFKIVPKKPTFSGVTPKKTSIYFKWTKPTGATNYQVGYRKYGNDTYKFKTTANNDMTLSGLTSGEFYQIKVRAYKLVDGVRYYSAWSTVKKVETLAGTTGGTTDDNTVTNTVYTTATGTKYHCTKSCRGLSNANAIYTNTLSKAKAAGLTPCSICY